MPRIAILGGGVMGETLLSALLAAGHRDVVVAEKFADRADALRSAHGVEVLDPPAAARGAEVLLVAVKPQDVPELLAEVRAEVAAGAVVVSLAAGVRTDVVEGALEPGVAVVRAMPNTPALVGEGMFGVSAGASAGSEQVDAVVSLLATAGDVAVVEEARQDAVTAVSGSGPAYVFYLAEAMVAAGVAEGLEEEVAQRLATQTLTGAAALLAGSDDGPAELRRKVTSPNGTTAAAIESFDAAGLQDALVDGIRAAARRSAELSGS